MSLDVDPEEVARFGGRIDGLSTQCRDAASYVLDGLSLERSDVGEIFALVLPAVLEIRDELVANLDAMRRLTEDSASNLELAANEYRIQEQENRIGFDSISSGGSWP